MTNHQYLFPLRQTKKPIWNPFKKEIVHQFNIGYMTHPALKKYESHRDKVINFSIGIQTNHIKLYQKRVIKK